MDAQLRSQSAGGLKVMFRSCGYLVPCHRPSVGLQPVLPGADCRTCGATIKACPFEPQVVFGPVAALTVRGPGSFPRWPGPGGDEEIRIFIYCVLNPGP